MLNFKIKLPFPYFPSVSSSHCPCDSEIVDNLPSEAPIFMENLSRSISQTSYGGGSNALSTSRTMHDDVFRGQQRLIVPKISPHIEDFREIFSSFRSSGASSIPLLDLPPFDDSELSFDFWSSKFDYSEVFGVNCLDFSQCWEELLRKPKGGGDASSKSWTPGYIGSLSNESDPPVYYEKNRNLLNIEHCLSFGIEQFNITYPNTDQTSDVLHVLSGHSFMSSEIRDARKRECGNSSRQDEKVFKRSISYPPRWGPLNEPSLIFTDMSPRTQLSLLQPPSRPPPVSTLSRECSSGLVTMLTPSRSHEQPFSDTEVGASFSAMASSAGLKNLLEKFHVEKRTGKDRGEKKKEYKIFEKGSLIFTNEKNDEALNGLDTGKGQSTCAALGKEYNLLKECPGEEMNYSSKPCKVISDSKNEAYVDIDEDDIDGRMIERGHKSCKDFANTRGAFAWKEAAEFYEAGERESCRRVQDLVKNATLVQESCEMEKKMAVETPDGQRCVKVESGTEKCQKWDKNDQCPEVSKGVCEWDKKGGRLKENDGSSLSQMEHWWGSEMICKGSMLVQCERVRLRQHGGTDSLSKKTYKCESLEEIELNENEKEANRCLKGRNERIRQPERTADASRSQAEETLEDTFRNDNYGQKITEAVNRTGNENGQLEILELEEKDKQQREAHEILENTKEYIVTENVNASKYLLQKGENERRLKEAGEQKEKEKNQKESVQNEVNEKKLKEPCSNRKDETKLKEADDRVENKKKFDSCKMEGGGIGLKDTWGHKEYTTMLLQTQERGTSEKTTSDSKELGAFYTEKERNDSTVDVQFDCRQDTRRGMFSANQVIGGWNDNKWKNEGSVLDVSQYKCKMNLENTTHKSRNHISKEKNLNKTSHEDRERGGAKDQKINLQTKMEEEREQEREREKDRMFVYRATLEAHERTKTVSTMEAAMIRAERAAVRRAITEAKERAFQKAMAERVSFETQDRVESFIGDKAFTTGCSGIQRSFFFSDVQIQKMETLEMLKCSNSSVHEGVEVVSPQQYKARLDRHQKTAECAVKALAEKHLLDFRAQSEQSDRYRLAETLDAEVKRWSSGKEGNLRALLSTLQYILGPESGWQPIPLTEIITSAAVKKSYRKATLCVHPDKLQQRGASIQQKHMSEKVFDLLKEAWNKFNAEEHY